MVESGCWDTCIPGCPGSQGGDHVPLACPTCGRGSSPEIPIFPAGFHGPACPNCDWDDPFYFEGGPFMQPMSWLHLATTN
jgi:hypothetical protein